MLLSASSIVGVFSSFIQIQTQLDLPIPWYVYSLFFCLVKCFARLRRERILYLPILLLQQVLSLLYNRWIRGHPFHGLHLLAHCDPSAVAGHCHDRRLYALRLVACRLGYRVGSALGAERLDPEHLQPAGV